MTDQELKDLVASLAIAQAKTDAQIAKTDAQLAKTDAQLAKTDAQLAKTDAQLAATSAEVRELSRVVNEVSRRMGAMASNQGDVAEEFFYNSLREKLQLGAIKFDSIAANSLLGTKKAQSEFDLLLVNGESVAVIEVKYKAHVNDLEQVQKKVQSYRELRPDHKHFKVFGGIAGFSVPQDVLDAAQKKGFFVLQRKGDVMATVSEGMLAF